MDTTTEQPAPPTPKPAREPIDADDRAMLIGLTIVLVSIATSVTLWVNAATHSNNARAHQKTQQVEACAKLPEGTAAYACVVQIDG
jgi:hypothetical protein